MFVAAGARDLIAAERQQGFRDHFVAPLLAEAGKLGLATRDVIRLIEKEAEK